ncbi:unnamed protein product [Mytilus coruscus]|uniref:Uncharacterized protein n=1 Tax=Mytilus coruscus TaxID=42192 RepID=A0A6J8A4I1_MYTCO|nr:unnamed protein product [Mytilus coruscus]
MPEILHVPVNGIDTSRTVRESDGFLIGLSEERRKPNDLNVSLEPPNPLYFWQLRSSKHDQSYLSQHSYAVLYNVSAPQLSSITAGTEVLDFSPTISQFVKISSIQDYAAAGFVNAMTIGVNIYFTSITQNTPLIQFFDATGQLTINIRLQGIDLFADWVDSNGIWYNGILTKLKTAKWILVGFTFNMKWTNDDQVDLFFVDSKGTTAAEMAMGKGTFTLPAFDSIVIGGDGNTKFQGEMNCVQFYPHSIIGGTRSDSQKLCDQNAESPDYGDFSIDSFNLPILTTEELTTTEAVTTVEITTEAASTIAGITSEVSTDAATTDAAASKDAKTSNAATIAEITNGVAIMDTVTTAAASKDAAITDTAKTAAVNIDAVTTEVVRTMAVPEDSATTTLDLTPTSLSRA